MTSKVPTSSADVAVLQWNCRGYKANYEDIQYLLHQYSPTCVLLQETMLGIYSPLSPGRYNIHSYSPTGRAIPGDGLATLIKQGTPFQPLNLISELQVQAFRIQHNGLYTICNIYISPQEHITVAQINNLISQLPTPFIISGDFNSKHYLWGNNSIDAHGRVIETVLEQNNVIVLNSRLPTHYHIQSSTFSALDLMICSPDVCHDMEWDVHSDLCGSDHFPTLLKTINNDPVTREPKYILERGNWKLFYVKTFIANADTHISGGSIDECVQTFNEIIISAADAAIPKSSGRAPRFRVPWWSADCALVTSERKKLLRKYQRTKSVADRIHYNRARARAKLIQCEARKTSWKSYVNKLNIDTPMSQIWKRVKKMTGKYQTYTTPFLMQNGMPITKDIEVAETLAEHYEYVSSDDRYEREVLT